MNTLYDIEKFPLMDSFTLERGQIVWHSHCYFCFLIRVFLNKQQIKEQKLIIYVQIILYITLTYKRQNKREDSEKQ